MPWWWHRFVSDKQLWAVESLLRKVIRNQETLMSVLDDLKTAVAEVAADASAMHDEVNAALDHILKAVPDVTPELQTAVDNIREIHASLADSFKTLKDKVDSVVASGGPTT